MDTKDIDTANQQQKSIVVDKSDAERKQALRRQAEEKLQSWEKLEMKIDDLEESQQLVHELRIHQVELEMQNEELRRAQEQLTESRARYLDLYDFAPVGYMTVNRSGIILEVNRTAAALLGQVPGSILKQPFFRFILPEDKDIYYLLNKASFAENTLQTGKLRLLRTDRQPFWARLESGPVRDDGYGSKVCRMVLIDISDGVRLAAEKTHLEGQDRQLQKAESLGRMAGAIAHHFNNLLTVVMGNLELAMMEVPGKSDSFENLESAMEAAQRAATMSTSMLTYLGQTIGKRQVLDLSELCRISFDKLRAAIPKQVDVQVDFPTGGPTVMASAHQIEQVVKNLVTNSWESLADRKGTVNLSVSIKSPADILENHRFPPDWQAQECLYACLEVTDTGSGIDGKDIDKIFDPFFTQRFLGRGLGLPIVLGIVRAHSGVITVTSTCGSGSEFRVYLPIVTGEITQLPRLPRLPDQVIPVPETIEGGTILVVDDEPMLLEIVHSALSPLGFTVLLAKNGFEAVEIFRQHQDSIRCVLCDLVMPGMDGWKTLSALRQVVADIPVVLSSGYNQEEVMDGDHAEWPQYFLGKPYDLSGLLEAIRKAVANKEKGEDLSGSGIRGNLS